MTGRRSEASARPIMTAVAAAVVVALAGLAGWGTLWAAAPAKRGAAVKLGEIRLVDTAGKTRTLGEFRDRKALVVVFIGTACPLSNSYAEPLAKQAGRYESKGVQFLAVNANAGETLEAVAKHAKEFRLPFPVLKDEKQLLADRLGARVTPEAFVLDVELRVRYHGRIDDQYASRTQRRPEVSSQDLQTALDAVLAGKPVAAPVTTALGCAIVRSTRGVRTAAGPTYHKDVAPIVQARCQTCHRPGQIGPFSLMSYADARSWASEIAQFTKSRQMPPWKAEPGFGDFQDSRRLSDQEVNTLAAWADAGAPEGDPKDAPSAKAWPDGWMLGKPDLVLKVPEPFQVEASGDDVFHCFVLPTGLTEDKQVVAVEVKPGNPRVLHHVLNFLDLTGRGRQLDAASPEPGYATGAGGVGFLPSGALGGWAPGNLGRFLPPGVGMPLPKGSDVVLQVHYHKTGKPETDQTSVGVYFAKEPVTKRLRTLPFTNFIINIPPGETRYPVKAGFRIPFDAHALAITPHMHLLGREMKVTATMPDGTVKDMVWIKDWDYRWQDTYRYKEPLALPKGTQLELVAYYDNSPGNPRNPNRPPKRVTFGEQTTDEMCFAFIEYTMDQEPASSFQPARLFGR